MKCAFFEKQEIVTHTDLVKDKYVEEVSLQCTSCENLFYSNESTYLSFQVEKLFNHKSLIWKTFIVQIKAKKSH